MGHPLIYEIMLSVYVLTLDSNDAKKDAFYMDVNPYRRSVWMFMVCAPRYSTT